MSHSLLTTVQYVENNKKAAREYWIVEVKSLQWYCHMKSEAKWTFATFLSSFFLNLSLNFKNIWKALLKIETKIRKKNSGAFNLNPKMKYRHSLFIRLFFPSPVREEHSNNSADEFVCVFFSFPLSRSLLFGWFSVWFLYYNIFIALASLPSFFICLICIIISVVLFPVFHLFPLSSVSMMISFILSERLRSTSSYLFTHFTWNWNGNESFLLRLIWKLWR